MVVLVICDINIVISEIVLRALILLLARDLQEALIGNLLDLLRGNLINPRPRRSIGNQELFIRILNILVQPPKRFLPLPPEIGELVASLNELLRGEDAFRLEIFLGWGEF